jgi:hypothetical protein
MMRQPQPLLLWVLPQLMHGQCTTRAWAGHHQVHLGAVLDEALTM